MGGDKLCRDHAFEFIPWLDTHQRIDRRMAFPARTIVSGGLGGSRAR